MIMEDCRCGLKYKNLLKGSFFKGQKYYRPSDRVLTKWAMDCQNKTSKTQTIVVYDINDKVRQSSNGPFEESYIIPDTVAEKILYVACRRINE